MFIYRFFKASAFVRGMWVAFGVLAAAPQVIPYEVLDLASGMHAVIIGWRAIAGVFSALIGPYIGFPEMSPEVFSGLLLGLSLGSFFGLGVLRKEWGVHKGLTQNAAFWARALIPLVSTPIMSLFFVVGYPTLPFFFSGVYLTVSLVGVLSRFPAFRQGFFIVLGFVVFIEGVYLISTERMRSTFDEFVCQHTDGATAACLDKMK